MSRITGDLPAAIDAPVTVQTFAVIHWLRASVRLCVGAAFAYAAILKILHPHDFALTVFHYRLLPATIVNAFSLVLPWLELTCAVAFVCSRRLRSAAMLLLVGLLATFVIAIIINLVRGNDVECGCFGATLTGHSSSLWALIRDLILVGMILWSGREARSTGLKRLHLWRSFAVVVGLLCTAFTPSQAFARPATGTAETGTNADDIRNYSDVECLQAAMGVLGRPVDVFDLLRSPHLHRGISSSLEDIEQAAHDHGLQTLRFAAMTPRQLRHATTPVVLHVMANEHSAEPDHYVLFVGIKDDQARILTGPRSERLVSLGHLMLRWPGAAVVVSLEPIVTEGVVVSSLKQPVNYLLLGTTVAVIGMALWCRRRTRATDTRRWMLVRSLGQAALLLTAAAALGAFSDAFLGDHLLARANSVSPEKSLELLDFQPKRDVGSVSLLEVDVETARRLLSEGVLFIDVRGPNAYREGHIPGAINVPSGSPDKVRLGMGGIRKDKQLIVYCAGVGCNKSHYVASILKESGYTDIAVLKGGWTKWAR